MPLGRYCGITINSHSSLRTGEQVSEEPLGVVGLGRGLTQSVDEDGGSTVSLQHRADQSLKKDEEFLVLRGNTHLQEDNQREEVRWFQ